jgi:citrate synthase
MSDLTWTTAVTQINPNEVRLRGYRIDELMGKITFAQAIFLALRGELPSPDVGRLIDAILVSSIDHGVTPPSALAARTVASTGAPLNAAVAAGVLSINGFHGGAIFDCMAILQQLIHRTQSSDQLIDEAAEALIDEYKAQKKRIAGLGHRIHTSDPRTARLFTLAEEVGVSGLGVRAMQALADGYARRGKSLPINVDGAIAALLVDLDVPRELANAFFIMARVPGLVAHVYEEQTGQRPMRHIHPTNHTYDGPPARSLGEEKNV